MKLFNRKPKLRKNGLVYVAHGDIHWGNSISASYIDQEKGLIKTHGWLSSAPFPSKGDMLLVKGVDGIWRVATFTENAEQTRDPKDMFFAKASYLGKLNNPSYIPKTKNCDEFIPSNRRTFLR